MEKNQIDELLNPNSIALIGASNNSDKWSYHILKSIISAGYEGSICPVNPKDSDILGYKAYKSVIDISEPVDMAVLVIKAELVPGVLRQCVQKNVKIAVIITNGFREAGNLDLELELVKAIKGSTLRVLGPNIQGVACTSSKLNAMFNMIQSLTGNVGILSQSGSVSAYMNEKLNQEGIGVSAIVNLGNQVDLCESDFIGYFANDTDTNVLALYIEGPRDCKTLKDALLKNAMKKPITLLKPGSTDGGAKAAASHTGSIAGNDRIFTVACKQFGVVRCETTTEFADTVKCFALCKEPLGNRAIVFTSSGGIGSIMVDELLKAGLVQAQLPDDAIAFIKQSTGRDRGVGNVMDMEFDNRVWEEVLNTVHTNYERFFDIYVLVVADAMPGIEQVIGRLSDKTDKTVIVTYMSEGIAREQANKYCQEKRIPIYDCPDRTAKSLRNICWYYQKKRESLCM